MAASLHKLPIHGVGAGAVAGAAVARGLGLGAIADRGLGAGATGGLGVDAAAAGGLVADGVPDHGRAPCRPCRRVEWRPACRCLAWQPRHGLVAPQPVHSSALQAAIAPACGHQRIGGRVVLRQFFFPNQDEHVYDDHVYYIHHSELLANMYVYH